MDIRNKEEFQFFMQRAMQSYGSGSNHDDCYIELYNMLLRCFICADVDFDGRIGVEEFPSMVEQAALLPRKFGLNWWGEDVCPAEVDRIGIHEELFSKIDENSDGAVSFEEWLAFSLQHYQTKCSELPLSLDQLDKASFLMEVKKAGEEAGSSAHRAMYWFHWQCFQAADLDRDGLVSGGEFERMVEMATATQKRLGLPALLSSEEEREQAFQQVDQNGDGSISFDEWLKFANSEIMDKVLSS